MTPISKKRSKNTGSKVCIDLHEEIRFSNIVKRRQFRCISDAISHKEQAYPLLRWQRICLLFDFKERKEASRMTTDIREAFRDAALYDIPAERAMVLCWLWRAGDVIWLTQCLWQPSPMAACGGRMRILCWGFSRRRDTSRYRRNGYGWR